MPQYLDPLDRNPDNLTVSSFSIRSSSNQVTSFGHSFSPDGYDERSRIFDDIATTNPPPVVFPKKSKNSPPEFNIISNQRNHAEYSNLMVKSRRPSSTNKYLASNIKKETEMRQRVQENLHKEIHPSSNSIYCQVNDQPEIEIRGREDAKKIQTLRSRIERHEVVKLNAPLADDYSASSCSQKMNEKFADFFHVKTNNPATMSDKSTEKSELINYKEAAIREQVVNWKFKLKEKLNPVEIAERKDALTKKPLNFRNEEKTRKQETDRWLQIHFGSIEKSDSIRINATKTLGLRDVKQIYNRDPSKDEQFSRDKLRRTKSFSAFSLPHASFEQDKQGERFVGRTSTATSPFMEIFSTQNHPTSNRQESCRRMPSVFSRSKFCSPQNVESWDKSIDICQPILKTKGPILSTDNKRANLNPTRHSPANASDLFFDHNDNNLRNVPSRSQLDLTRVTSFRSYPLRQPENLIETLPRKKMSAKTYHFGENFEEKKHPSKSSKSPRLFNHDSKTILSSRPKTPSKEFQLKKRDSSFQSLLESNIPSTAFIAIPPESKMKGKVSSYGESNNRFPSKMPLYQTELQHDHLYPSPPMVNLSHNEEYEACKNKAMTKLNSKYKHVGSKWNQNIDSDLPNVEDLDDKETAWTDRFTTNRCGRFLYVRPAQRSKSFNFSQKNSLEDDSSFSSSTTVSNEPKHRLWGVQSKSSRDSPGIYYPHELIQGSGHVENSPGNKLKPHFKVIPRSNNTFRASTSDREAVHHIPPMSNQYNNHELLGNDKQFYEYEKRIPMHKTSMEALKFKTVIFLSGQ